MIRDYFERRARLLLALGLLILAPLVAAAGPRHPHDRCPDCGNAACVPSLKTVKEKKHCWCIECEPVCIPHIRWPWQSSCELPKCGYVKNVKVLKKVEYECEKCGCKWDAKCLGSCPGGVCRH